MPDPHPSLDVLDGSARLVMSGSRTQLHDLFSRCRGGFAAVAGFSFVINLLVLSTSVYMLQVYDRVLTGRSVETLVYLTLITAAALAAMGPLPVASLPQRRSSSWVHSGSRGSSGSGSGRRHCYSTRSFDELGIARAGGELRQSDRCSQLWRIPGTAGEHPAPVL